MNKKETSWGNVADWYDDLLENKEGTYQKEVILPNLMRLLNPQKNEVVLDNACGQGYFSRAIAETGAKVIGVDIAKELIEIAKKNSPKEISFNTSPSHLLGFIQDSSVDKAITILALQNIEKLNETLIETSRVLKKGGKFFFVLNHPAFRIPKKSSWQWDEENSKQYRRIDAYMSDIKEKIEMNPGARENDKEYTVSFHRPLQVYFKAINKAGFLVGRFEEWISHKESLKSARGDEENRIRKEIPMFAIIEAIKN
jgi:ubiquinone/menaquinone biosynthesis C-methylase UbiE